MVSQCHRDRAEHLRLINYHCAEIESGVVFLYWQGFGPRLVRQCISRSSKPYVSANVDKVAHDGGAGRVRTCATAGKHYVPNKVALDPDCVVNPIHTREGMVFGEEGRMHS